MKTISYIVSTVLLMSASSVFAGGDVAKGEAVYNKACFVCHKAGVANAPKLGDKANWAPRIKQGEAKLVEHAIKGFKGKKGFMPAKGGRADLSDQAVTDAVAYMVSKSK
jgi:cytochrome c5